MVALRETPPSRSRGRPRGRTPRSESTRKRLYDTALRLFATRGFASTTLREIGEEAEASTGLLYRYFPGKHAVVIAFYDELALEYARRAERMPAGSWRDRFVFTLRASLAVLGPHRDTLRALVPVLVTDGDGGLFSPQTASSRDRVRAIFRAAVSEARDRPNPQVADALGNLLYVLHLAVILMWLLDRSPGTRATAAAIQLLERGKSLAALAVRLPFAQSFILAADAIVRDSLLPPESAGAP